MTQRHFTKLPSSVVAAKHKRILAGNAPRTLDLFSGCGGLSLGFDAAGFKTIGAVEFEPDAARSHAVNFMYGLPHDRFEAHAAAKDITKIEPSDLMKTFGLADSLQLIPAGVKVDSLSFQPSFFDFELKETLIEYPEEE